MKAMKKLASLLLALVLVFSLGLTAFADDDAAETVPTSGQFSLTINNALKGHTYELYMIFYGNYHQATTSSAPILTDLKWGSGVTEYLETIVTPTDDAGDVAASVNSSNVVQFSKDLTLGNSFATQVVAEGSNSVTFSNLPAGYYLVKDKDNSQNATDSAYTSYIIRVVGNTEASPKVNVPTLKKNTSDINDSNQNEWTSHQSSADHDIGDNVPFHIHINLGNNIENYTDYQVNVTDTMSKGLTFNNDAVVKLAEKTLIKDKDYTIATSAGENGAAIIKFEFSDLIACGAKNGNTLVIEYTAKLNDGAVIGNPGNPNEAYMEYSNNPYTEEMGKTPVSKVVIFTYKVTVNKTDGTNPLNGATFKLSKQTFAGDWVEVKTIVSADIAAEDKAKFEFVGLDDGSYKLEEVSPPAGYNTIDPIFFDIEAVHTADSITTLTATAQAGSGQVFSTEVASGNLSTTVVNHMGATLPTTGGMGTTLIYAVGGILVLAAVVLLVTKKRMSDAE